MCVPATLAFVVVVALAGGGAVREQVATVVQDPEAYRVYEAVFRRERAVRAPRVSRIVVRAETVRNDACGVSGPAIEGEWKPVVESFRRENATPRALLPGFPLQPPYVLVTSVELESLAGKPRASDEWWKAFYDAYPDSGGYFQVSAVGFDQGRTRAMVYVAHACGSLCGSGQHHLLEQVDGAWREALPEGLTRCQWIARGGARPPESMSFHG